MAVVISLREVVEAIDSLSDDWESFLDSDTGQIVTVTEEERRLAEKGGLDDDLPEWQREMLPKVRAALESDRFLRLSDRLEVHEWAIMERFSRAQENERDRQELLHAIHGSGAFRTFKGAIRRLGLENSWYKFRGGVIEGIARDWLEAHKLPYK